MATLVKVFETLAIRKCMPGSAGSPVRGDALPAAEFHLYGGASIPICIPGIPVPWIAFPLMRWRSALTDAGGGFGNLTVSGCLGGNGCVQPAETSVAMMIRMSGISQRFLLPMVIT